MTVGRKLTIYKIAVRPIMIHEADAKSDTTTTDEDSGNENRQND